MKERTARFRSFIQTPVGCALIEGIIAAVCADVAGVLIDLGTSIPKIYVYSGAMVAWVLITVAVPYWLRSLMNILYTVREKENLQKRNLMAGIVAAQVFFCLGCALFVHGYLATA